MCTERSTWLPTEIEYDVVKGRKIAAGRSLRYILRLDEIKRSGHFWRVTKPARFALTAPLHLGTSCSSVYTECLSLISHWRVRLIQYAADGATGRSQVSNRKGQRNQNLMLRSVRVHIDSKMSRSLVRQTCGNSEPLSRHWLLWLDDMSSV